MTDRPKRERPPTPLRLIVFLARRGLAENRVISALLVLAVMCGVAFQIPNAANLQGYNQELLVQAVTKGFGQVRLSPREGQRFQIDGDLVDRLTAQPEVVDAVPVLVLAGAVGREGLFRNAAVIGVDPSARQPYRLVEGRRLGAGDDGRILVGLNASKRLDIHPGQQVELRVIFGIGDQLDDGVGKYTLEVAGVVSGTFVAPQSVYVDREFLARELGEPAAATLVAVYTRSHTGLGPLTQRISSGFPDLEVQTWQQASVFASSAIRSSAVLANLSRAMIALAVLVPVWALLYIHVLHRQRDIAILSAVGFGPSELFWLYLIQALLVGVVGVIIGAGFGYLFVRWFDAHPIFSMDVFVVRPVATAGAFVWPMLLVLGATLLASVVPAWRAARTDPAAILRERAA